MAIEVTSDEFFVLVEMFLGWSECKHYDWDRYEIHDKRHNVENRKEGLERIYEEALRLQLVKQLLWDATVHNLCDEDEPWVNNDFENLMYENPLGWARRLAKDAGLEDYMVELEKRSNNGKN